MIDTIVLLFPFHHFTITQLNKFTPNAQFVYSHTYVKHQEQLDGIGDNAAGKF